MATVRMSHLKIVANKDDKKDILKLLTKSGCFEIAKSEDIEDEDFVLPIADEALKSNLSKAAFAIDYLYEVLAQPKSADRISLDFNEIDTINIQALLDICDELKNIKEKRDTLNKAVGELSVLSKDLSVYEGVPIPFSKFSDTLTTGIILATAQPLADKASLKKFDCYIQDFSSDTLQVLGILCKIDDKPRLVRKLNSQGFSICEYTFDTTASDLITLNTVQIDKMLEEDAAILESLTAYKDHLTTLKILHDILTLELEQHEAAANIFSQDSTITIEGWVPSTALKQVKNILKNQIPNLDIESRNAKLGDSPPSLSVNSKLARPFENIAAGYGAPTYGELDPTPVMSIFFFIFFGIMLADAGYGLIMAVGGLSVAIFSKKFAPMKRMIIMLAICGISGIIFGLLFGGVFAISTFPALWFNPMHEPLMMLIFSIALGVVHLLTGFTMRTIKTIKTDVSLTLDKKTGFLKVLDGLFDSIFIYLLFIGILFLLMPMLFDDINFPFGAIAAVMLIVALAGILLTSGRRAPSLGGKVIGGLGGLYRLINIFSDVLSYSRLFGLALASGAIAMAFNQIGMMLIGMQIPVLNWILGGIILVVLHAFNFALAALAAYVHDIRLQYVEFFGKFYDGNGRFFAPLGNTIKYVDFINTTDIKELN